MVLFLYLTSLISHFQFVEKLASRPPTMEKKLQLLQDIASEFSIKWDSKGFEKRMASPSAFIQACPFYIEIFD